MKLFLTAVLLVAAIPADAAASGAPRHDAVILANAWGDTVWFGSDTLMAGWSSFPDGADVNELRARFRHLVPRTCSNDVVLVIASDGTASPRESPGALIERWATIGSRRLMARVFPPEVSPAAYEPGCFDDRSMRWPCGWELNCEAGSRPSVRMTFVVMGRPVGGPTARRGPDGAPVPITNWGHLRIYDLSSEEVRATARVIGDVIVDFDRRLLIPLETKGTTVARGDAQRLFTLRR